MQLTMAHGTASQQSKGGVSKEIRGIGLLTQAARLSLRDVWGPAGKDF